MTSKKDQQQIEEARLRTVKRLREKQEKLRQKEELRRQHDIAQANEKWRLRDAKLAADRQRRMQRKRFEGMKRTALTEKISNRRQEMMKRKQPPPPQQQQQQPLTSILKKSGALKTKISKAGGGGPDVRFDGDLRGEGEGNMADMSAVFEDVEEWVKSVYGGDENSDVRHGGGGEGSLQRQQKNQFISQDQHEEENEDWQQMPNDRQQAEEDEAFLDAILQES